MFKKKILTSICLFLMLFVFTVSFAPTSTNSPVLRKAPLDNVKEYETFYITTKNTDYLFKLGQGYENSRNALEKGEVALLDRNVVAECQFLVDYIVSSKPINVVFEPTFFNGTDLDANIIASCEYGLYVFNKRFDYNEFLKTEDNLFDEPVFRFKLDSTAPSIDGTNNFVVNVNKMLTQEEILSHVTAVDETDGLLTPTVVSSTYNPSNKQTGVFNIVIAAEDKRGNRSEMTITVHVVDVDKPVISASTPLEFSYDNIPSVTEVLNKLTVIDNYDSNLKAELVTDNYSSHGGNIGVYNVVVNATDSSGNVSGNQTFEVKLVDRIKPNIVVNGLNGSKELHVGNNKLLTESELRALISVTDAYKGGNPTYTLTGYKAYQEKYTKTGGSFEITIDASDASGNKNQLKFNVVVDDTTAPSFNLDNYFVVLGKDVVLTDEQIKSLAAKVLGVTVSEIKNVELNDTNNPNIKCAKITLNDERVVEINIEQGVNIVSVVMSWYHYLYKWFTVLFNFDNYYKTGNFFNFTQRCKEIVKIYTEGVFYKRLG